MKKHILSAACLLAMSAANATYCGPNTVHAGQPEPWYPNRCNEGATPTPTPTAAPTSNTLTGEQRQQQAQLQGQAQRQQAEASARAASTSAGGAATSNAAGGRSSANAAGAGAGAGAGSGIVTIQGAEAGSGAQTNIRESTVFIPAAAVTQASIAMPGNISSREGACGPLQLVVRTPMYAIHNGPLGGREEIYQGDHYEASALLGPDGFTPMGFRRVQLSQTETILYGHRKIYSRTVLTGSSLAHLNVAGWGTSGGGSVGGGGSSAVTKFGTEIDLEDCEMGRLVQRTEAPSLMRSPIMMPVSRPKAKRRIVKTDPCIASCRVKSTGSLVLGN